MGRFCPLLQAGGEGRANHLPVPTPSAVRGMLASIYSKPAEFYWQVQRIEVLKKIQYATFKRNELKSKMPRIPAGNPMKACLLIEEDRTQRQSVVLRDVRYRITAQIVPRPDFPGSAIQLYNQFERRVKRGQMFVQPVMAPGSFRPISPGAPPGKRLSRRAWTWGSWCTTCLT